MGKVFLVTFGGQRFGLEVPATVMKRGVPIIATTTLNDIVRSQLFSSLFSESFLQADVKVTMTTWNGPKCYLGLVGTYVSEIPSL